MFEIVGSKMASSARTQPRSRSAERVLQRNRGIGSSGVTPGVKQPTLKLISMKPSPTPPPKPVFLVPKQPNPTSRPSSPFSPIPPSTSHSGIVSGLLYNDRKPDYEEFDVQRESSYERILDRNHEKDADNSDNDPLDDEECQVHPRNKERFSSMSHYSLPSRNSTTFKYAFIAIELMSNIH